MAPFAKKGVESRPLRFWGFVMLSANEQAINAFIEGARVSGQPFSVLAVWFALGAHLERDTGFLTCSQRQLAKTAGMAVGEVHRAIDKLVEMGVLLREEKGKYRVHPSSMWRGGLDRRGEAEETAPRLTLVEGGKAD